MTGLGGSRPIQARWNYVQPEEPTDRRDGVRWIDTSWHLHGTRVYTSVYDEWMRETRVWVQGETPAPRVGPIDGDQWIDTSTENRVTRIYSAALEDWSTPVPQQTEVAQRGYGWIDQGRFLNEKLYDGTSGTANGSHSNPNDEPFDEVEITGGGGNITLDHIEISIGGEVKYTASNLGTMSDFSQSILVDGYAYDVSAYVEISNSSAVSDNGQLYARTHVQTVAAHSHQI